MSSSSGSASLAHEMIDKLRVSELKALCSEKNLTQYGKKGVLVKRPKDHVDRELWSEQVRQPDLPPTPESLGEGECRAILMGTAKIGTDDAETIESARESLHTVLEDDELEVDHNLPQLAVGNRRGLELASLPDRVRVLESSLAKVQHKLSVRETTIMSLQGQVNDLTLNADSHRAIRQRFVVFFKRDKAPDSPLDDYDHKCMAEGNSVAHGGDAKADAELYRGFKARVDFHIYKRLYGYQPEIIWRIGKPSSLLYLLRVIWSLRTYQSGLPAKCH